MNDAQSALAMILVLLIGWFALCRADGDKGDKRK